MAERSDEDEPYRAEVRSADWPADLETIRGLFREYREWLAAHRDPAPTSQARVEAGLALVDLLIDGLPGAYGPPTGDVLVWREDDRIVAVAAIRAIEPGLGEAKRVSIAPSYRGGEFGRVFARAVIERARALGFRRLRVDVLPTMSAAIEFYQEAGFLRAEPSWPHPVAGALFFERSIGD